MKEKMNALFEEFKSRFFDLAPASTTAAPVLGGKYVDTATGDLYVLAKSAKTNGQYALALTNLATGLRRHKNVVVGNSDSITASEWSAITGEGNLLRVNL